MAPDRGKVDVGETLIVPDLLGEAIELVVRVVSLYSFTFSRSLALSLSRSLALPFCPSLPLSLSPPNSQQAQERDWPPVVRVQPHARKADEAVDVH